MPLFVTLTSQNSTMGAMLPQDIPPAPDTRARTDHKRQPVLPRLHTLLSRKCIQNACMHPRMRGCMHACKSTFPCVCGHLASKQARGAKRGAEGSRRRSAEETRRRGTEETRRNQKPVAVRGLPASVLGVIVDFELFLKVVWLRGHPRVSPAQAEAGSSFLSRLHGRQRRWV